MSDVTAVRFCRMHGSSMLAQPYDDMCGGLDNIVPCDPVVMVEVPDGTALYRIDPDLKTNVGDICAVTAGRNEYDVHLGTLVEVPVECP